MRSNKRRIAVGVPLLLFLSLGNLYAQALPPNPVPHISQPLVPMSMAPGGTTFTLTVNGAGFVATSQVNWNGSARTTTFVSSSQVTAAILAADIAAAGTASVTVVNPSPGGGTSNVAFFHIINSFSPVAFSRAAYAGGTDPISVITADFDADGALDLAVTNQLGTPISVFLGNGDGTFQAKVDYATGTAAVYSIVAGDFDADGNLDLAVTSGGSVAVSILTGNGDGTFQAVGNYSTDNGPFSIAAGDFDADGSLDLVTSNSSGNTVSVLLGNGDASFQAKVDYATGSQPVSVIVADLDGDGSLDLAVANSGSNTVSVLLGNGDGTFQAKVDYATGFSPYSVSAADFNGDASLDLATANFNSNTVSVLLGNGNGTFASKVDYVTGSVPKSVTTGDFDGDGEVDLVAANFNSDTVSVLLGIGDGTFQAKQDFSTGDAPNSVVAGDFNGDGMLDLATADQSDAVSVLLQGPVVDLSVTSLSFGDNVIDLTSATQTITLTNTGNASLYISDISITGTDSGDFAQVNDCPLVVQEAALAAGASCTITVTFTPTALGTRTASVTITDDAADSPQTVNLTGRGVSAAVVGFSAASLPFGEQVFNTTSDPQPVTLTNNGAGPLGIADIATSGDFAEIDDCPASLAIGASCTINLTFTPTDVGVRVGALTITDDAAGSPHVVALSGTGLAPAVTFSPDPLNFGKQPPNTPTAALPVTLTNSGTAPLNVTDIQAGNPEFAVAGGTCTAGTTLAVGDSCTLAVTYTPAPAVACSFSSGNVNVTSDVVGGGSSLSLQGQVGAADGLLVDMLGTQSPTTLVNNLLGPGVTVSNITYSGTSSSAGTFAGGQGIIGFDAGIVLSSGIASSVIGPNCSDGTTGVNDLPGDDDLTTLSGFGTFDATVLEFDFVPTTDSLTFQYVFSSEEYNEFANSSVNNVFGFFVNGTNVALLPDTNIPVAINTVNGGNPLGTNAQNPEFFINNDVSDGGGDINTEMDGLTVVLTAQTTVNAGLVNHIKLGIADAGDSILDSNVFIRAGSFSSLPAVTFTPSSVNFPGNPLDLNCPFKPVTVTNTGTVPLNISIFAATPPFFVDSDPTHTTCGVPSTIQPGATCIIAVKFQPTIVGVAEGTLTITSDAVSGSDVVSLTGNGTPPCNLLASRRSAAVLRGTEAVNFSISDPSPSCSPVPLELSCTLNDPVSCEFSPAVIAPSGSSALRVSKLAALRADLLSLVVNSRSEFRTASVGLTVLVKDFAFSSAPAVATVDAGGTASYALAIRPVNGFAGKLTLTCSGAPRGATCTVEPGEVTLDGASLAQARVNVRTTARAMAGPSGVGSNGRPGGLLLLVALLSLVSLLGLAAVRRVGAGFKPAPKLALGLALLMALTWAACGGGGLVSTVGTSGTPPGTSALTVTGTYTTSPAEAAEGAPHQVTQSTTLSLTVR